MQQHELFRREFGFWYFRYVFEHSQNFAVERFSCFPHVFRLVSSCKVVPSRYATSCEDQKSDLRRQMKKSLKEKIVFVELFVKIAFRSVSRSGDERTKDLDSFRTVLAS
jgi:hypothetical protein